jgi:hypothetical protein
MTLAQRSVQRGDRTFTLEAENPLWRCDLPVADANPMEPLPSTCDWRRLTCDASPVTLFLMRHEAKPSLVEGNLH